MAKKTAVKEEPQASVIDGLIESIAVNMESLSEELKKSTQVAAAAKRARLLTSILAKQFKEFRAVSVAHFKK